MPSMKQHDLDSDEGLWGLDLSIQREEAFHGASGQSEDVSNEVLPVDSCLILDSLRLNFSAALTKVCASVVGRVQTQGQVSFGVDKLRSVKFPASKMDGTSVLDAGSWRLVWTWSRVSAPQTHCKSWWVVEVVCR